MFAPGYPPIIYLIYTIWYYLCLCIFFFILQVTSTRERKFAEIMQHYRTQPQASSHIYRQVLIDKGEAPGDAGLYLFFLIYKLRIIDCITGNQNKSEKRGDLISFYNTVYILAMKSFALQFSTSSEQVKHVLFLAFHI